MYIQVELFTADHLIRGFVNSPGERISDILNIRTESALFLSDVEVTRHLGMGKVPPIKFMEARVEKRSILFAVPLERDITHKSLFRKAQRSLFDVLVLLPGFEIMGSIHLTEKFELRRIMVTRADDFIPLTSATATYALYPSLTILKDTIIINKSQVIFIGERLPREEAFDEQPPAAQ